MLNISRVCRVVSLKEEMELFLDYYDMKFRKEFNLFPIYSDHSEKNWLVISGVGSLNVSFASIYLKNCSKSKSNVSWINFGYGLTNSKTCNCFVIDEIIKSNTNEKLYPSIVNIGLFERSKICTVEKFKNSNNFFQDLDSFSFFNTISKYVSKELIAIIKIAINKKNIQKKNYRRLLIKQNFEKIIKIEKILMRYSDLESLNILDVKYFEEIIKKVHFTTSEKFQLINLLKSWNNLYSHNLTKQIEKFSKSYNILKFLKGEISKGEFNW